MKKLFGLLMVLAMAGAFMTISMDQSHGEPIATISHEIEIAGSGGSCSDGPTCAESGDGCVYYDDDKRVSCPDAGVIV